MKKTRLLTGLLALSLALATFNHDGLSTLSQRIIEDFYTNIKSGAIGRKG